MSEAREEEEKLEKTVAAGDRLEKNERNEEDVRNLLKFKLEADFTEIPKQSFIIGNVKFTLNEVPSQQTQKTKVARNNVFYPKNLKTQYFGIYK